MGHVVFDRALRNRQGLPYLPIGTDIMIPEEIKLCWFIYAVTRALCTLVQILMSSV